MRSRGVLAVVLMTALVATLAATLPAGSASAVSPSHVRADGVSAPVPVAQMPPVIYAPTPFVLPDTFQGDPVCQLDLNGRLAAAAPFVLTYYPGYDAAKPAMNLHYCSSQFPDGLFFRSKPALQVVPPVVPKSLAVDMVNSSGLAGTLTVHGPDGTVYLTQALDPGSSRVTLPSSLPENRWVTATMATAEGTIDVPVVRPRGWTLRGDKRGAFTRCAPIRWTYDRAGEPSWAPSTIEDVRAAMALISSASGLTFQEVPERLHDPGTIYIHWGPESEDGHPGQTMSIDEKAVVWLNPENRRTMGRGGLPSTRSSRGWVLVHELMHVVGFDHVQDKRSVMYPVVSKRPGLSAGDRAGLRLMFDNGPC